MNNPDNFDKAIEQAFKNRKPIEPRHIPLFKDRNNFNIKDITFPPGWRRDTKRRYKAALVRCAKKQVEYDTAAFWQIMSNYGFEHKQSGAPAYEEKKSDD